MYHKSTGNWYIRSLVSDVPITFGQNWGGGPGMVPVSGDYNGDGVWDLAVYDERTHFWHWYIRSLGPGLPITFGQQWGIDNGVPVSGDYNGDGVWDLAIYQTTTGDWYIRPLGPGPDIAYGRNWGNAGMVPVSGDYNGDGIYDLAVYIPERLFVDKNEIKVREEK